MNWTNKTKLDFSLKSFYSRVTEENVFRQNKIIFKTQYKEKHFDFSKKIFTNLLLVREEYNINCAIFSEFQNWCRYNFCLSELVHVHLIFVSVFMAKTCQMNPEKT